MKTSNKIIISFLTFAWLSVTAMLLISHQFADYDNIPGVRKVVTSKINLGDFSVVKIEQAAFLKIAPGYINQLDYDELTGADMKPPEVEAIQDYSVRNDTLFIRNLRRASNGNYTLRVNNLKKLIVFNAWEVDLEGFRQDSLSIISANSKLLISKKSKFSYLHLASLKKFDLKFSSADDFELRLSNGQCEVSGGVDQITGIVGNYAELIIPTKIGKLDIDTSENGKLTLK
ncbi:hypothetical protein [Algoriphagus antarcticus]|uniref:Adhesin domain-containing protein n=1 Tax=Algoriphagus antarcticus TaxID=238540 RepID=A0A3E0E3P5_9BACT|nr:hypothetical protein [Algoriphagus antarcticus]REG91566.1 hypothetical protein C8N25_104180 [Algoriphagus antarcticus]